MRIRNIVNHFIICHEIKRYYINKRIREIFVFTNHILNGYHITWYVNQNVSKMVMYVNAKKENQEVLYFQMVMLSVLV